MRVPPIALWVVPVADLAGVARHVLDVARQGIPGYRIVVVCPEGPLAHALRSHGCAVTTADVDPASGTYRSVMALRAVVRALRPAIVHSHLSYADVITALGATGYAKLVSTEHGIAAHDLVYHGSAARSRAKALMHTARLRAFSALIACSHATRETMIAKWHAPESVTVIHNGVDPLEQRATHGGLRIGVLSRLSPEKQVDRVIDAFAHLVRAHPQATLTVAGSGELLASLTEQAAHVGAPVLFVGHVDPVSFMSEIDVIAQLSIWENCSYTLLDAITRGLGVVATDVGGNPEILPDQCLVSSSAPDEVAAALVAQGQSLQARPSRPADWPSVGEMCDSIAVVYRGLR